MSVQSSLRCHGDQWSLKFCSFTIKKILKRLTIETRVKDYSIEEVWFKDGLTVQNRPIRTPHRDDITVLISIHDEDRCEDDEDGEP